MNATISALRAITALYFRRLLIIGCLILGSIAAGLLILVVWLGMAFSDWWWMLLIPIGVLVVVTIAVGAWLWVLTDKLLPRPLARQESRQVKDFTDKLFGLVEQTSLSYPVLAVLIGKDVLHGHESTLLRDAVDDSSSLKTDFASIKEMFS